MILERLRIEEKENWLDWLNKIPFIPFKREWEIKVIPPFGGAMIRFLVSNGIDVVSIFLDCFNNQGFFKNGEPYWEIFPYKNDVYRIAMNDVDTLVAKIEGALSK